MISDGVAMVEDGLAAGDRVVTAGQYRLRPGPGRGNEPARQIERRASVRSKQGAE